jgi:hypothetical protein
LNGFAKSVYSVSPFVKKPEYGRLDNFKRTPEKMDRATHRAITSLITHILGTTNQETIDRSLQIALVLIEAPITSRAPKSLKFWESRWKSAVPAQNRDHLFAICRDLPQTSHPMYKVLNDLRFTQKLPIAVKPKVTDARSQRRSLNLVSESEIVADLVSLLQGGTGNRISIENGGLRVEGLFSPPHSFVVAQVLRVVTCLYVITNTIPQLKGVVGQSIADGLQTERRDFILALSSIRPSETSLLSLFSVVSGGISERIFASAVICRAIARDSEEESVINSLALTQNHGNQLVQSIAANLLRLGIAVLVDFIKEWVVYGRLDDPYGEFFIARSDSGVETWDWWNSKFIVVSHRIPLFLVDESMIAEIVAGGRAWNFVRKFKTMESGFPSEGNFEGREFSLRLVNIFYSEAMRYAMRILMESVWIPGHLRALHDFILFFRGDFASTLFSILSNERWAESLNLLVIPLQACAPGASSTNKLTGEKLTERIDLQIKTALDHASMKLVYRVDSPLDTLFDPESLANYRKLSKLLWRFKCCEYHLTARWRTAKRLQILHVIARSTSFSPRTSCWRAVGS